MLEYFFGMPHNIAVAYMYRIHNHQKAICGTYSREEAEKKVADVLAFAAENKYPRPNAFLRKRTEPASRAAAEPLTRAADRGQHRQAARAAAGAVGLASLEAGIYFPVVVLAKEAKEGSSWQKSLRN